MDRSCNSRVISRVLRVRRCVGSVDGLCGRRAGFRFCGNDPLIANRCADHAPACIQRPCSRSMDRSYDSCVISRVLRVRRCVGSVHVCGRRAVLRFCRSDPLIANRCADHAPACIQRPRSRSMDRSYNSRVISRVLRVRQCVGSVDVCGRRAVLRFCASDPLIANRRADHAPAYIQRPRSRSMDRSYNSHVISRVLRVRQCVGSVDGLCGRRAGFRFCGNDPLIANRRADHAPACIQRPCSRSMDRSYDSCVISRVLRVRRCVGSVHVCGRRAVLRFCGSDPLIANRCAAGTCMYSTPVFAINTWMSSARCCASIKHLRIFNARVRDQWIAPTTRASFHGFCGFGNAWVPWMFAGDERCSVFVGAIH
jgi:hypothetical protein